ncbi:hypothetical protein GCM10010483_44210 [Actinokineospora diospyrosa]
MATEHSTLMNATAAAGHHDLAWWLPHATGAYLEQSGYHEEYQRALRTAVTSAGDGEAEASSLADLGRSHMPLGKLRDAQQRLHQAVACTDKSGNQRGQCAIRFNLGKIAGSSSGRCLHLKGAAEPKVLHSPALHPCLRHRFPNSTSRDTASFTMTRPTVSVPRLGTPRQPQAAAGMTSTVGLNASPQNASTCGMRHVRRVVAPQRPVRLVFPGLRRLAP